MKINKVEIKRFRSIQNLSLQFTETTNLVTVCGANNTGKTNVLRAINLFFNPGEYRASEDSPNHKYYGSRGGNSYPEIRLVFINVEGAISINRTFGSEGIVATTGRISLNKKERGLSEKEIEKYLGHVAFFFIPSINISFPELINKLIEDVYDLEYERTRFRGLKHKLKVSFEEYINGTVQILNQLADEINPVFEEFNSSWNVGFEFTSDVQEFRDLISKDIQFYLNDKSNRNIEGKGSGLQRLGYILLHSRIIQKLAKKSVILLIDEPDIYLHQGLQKKLKKHLLDLAKKNQVIISTHSPVFIDTYKLENVFLLDLEIEAPITYRRTGKDFYPLSTKLINLYDHNGQKLIQEYLGITYDDFELLDRYNLLVEGDCDKKYITELCCYFGIEICKIVSVHGVPNFEKHLNFYNSYYEGREIKPTILVLFDNDTGGRDEFRKLHKKISRDDFKNINIRLMFVPTASGEEPDINHLSDCRVNYEIEDFIFPELLLSSINEILKRKGMSAISSKTLRTRITAKAFREKGILYNLDLLKNEKNPENGNCIDFAGEQAKRWMAELFNLQGNKRLSEKIIEQDLMYPKVREFLAKLMDAKLKK